MILVNISIRGKNTIQADQEGLFELAILNFMFKRYNWSIPPVVNGLTLTHASLTSNI
jgi:hypothetical protein